MRSRYSGGAGLKAVRNGTPISEGWAILLKMGQREHLEQFRKRGLLHINSSRYFAEQELKGDGLRWDRFEGADRLIQPGDLKQMTMTPKDGPPLVVPGSQFVGPVVISFGNERTWNVFCMFTLGYPFESPLVDERNLAFGDSFIVIVNPKEFLRRAGAAATKAGFGWSYGPVEYRDYETYSGETGPFCKPLAFAFQKEFRFAVRPGRAGPIRLRIGDLTDITSPVLRLAKIKTLIEIRQRPRPSKTRLFVSRKRRLVRRARHVTQAISIP